MVLNFWDEFFASVDNSSRVPKIIDIASGSGAVVERASAATTDQLADFTCLDISAAAISTLTERFPQVQGVVADACSIPLSSARYDIATSQFGIEYAAPGAVDEVDRLLAPGGQLAFLLHHKAGGIYRQCSASLDAIEQLRGANFISACKATFEARFAAYRGGDRKNYETAAKQFVPAIRAIESVMKQHGTEVADGTIVRLYKDVRTVHERLANYDPAEVLRWLDNMQDEISAFGGRMKSMCESAMSTAAFEQLCNKLRQQKYEIVRDDPLETPDRGVPLAWALIATKS